MSDGASARARDIRRQLEQLARSQGVPLDRLIQVFAAERFLFRLANSPWAERFVVKGAVLLLPARPLRSGRGYVCGGALREASAEYSERVAGGRRCGALLEVGSAQ